MPSGPTAGLGDARFAAPGCALFRSGIPRLPTPRPCAHPRLITDLDDNDYEVREKAAGP